MKKVLASIVLSTLLLAGLFTMVSMSPPYNATQCKSDCEFLVSVGFFSGNGQCRSACATCTNPSESSGTGAACLCKLADAGGGLGESTIGQCISSMRR